MALSAILVPAPGLTAEFELVTRGTLVFRGEQGEDATNLVDDSVSQQLRSGLNMQWDGWNGQNAPVRLADENRLAITPMRDNDWTTLRMEVKFPATSDLLRYSDGIVMEVFVRSRATQFWGEEHVKSDWVSPLDVEFRKIPFELVLYETKEPDEIYRQMAGTMGQFGSSQQIADAMDTSIRIFKIDGNEDYLDLLARLVEKYVETGQPLHVDTLKKLQEDLPRHLKFTNMPHVTQAEKLHQLAYFITNPASRDVVAGTNAVTYRQVALTILGHLPTEILTETPEGTPLPEAFQEALTLEMDIICKDDPYRCLDNMYKIRDLDRLHPFRTDLMWTMMSGFLTALVEFSRDGAPAGGDSAFVSNILEDDMLRDDWMLVPCIIENHRDRRRGLKRRLRDRENEERWVNAIWEAGQGQCS